MGIYKFTLCVLFLCLGNAIGSDQPEKSESFLKFLSKTWKHCTVASSLSLCLKQRSLLALDRLTKTNDAIPLPGEMMALVKLSKDTSYKSGVLSEDDLENNLPKDLKLQDQTLNLLLQSAYTKFLSSRSLQIRFPQFGNNYSTGVAEGRGDKKNKGGGFASGAMMAACMMFPMALAGIGMMAGKAMMTSMLALMLAALLGMRKGHEGGGGSSYEVISLPAGGHHSHHGRSLSAHDLAYGSAAGIGVAPEAAAAATR